MKRRVIKISLLIVVVLLCTACNGNVTRDIRHSGFTVGNKFICDMVYPENKNDTLYKKIKYMTGTNIIDDNGYIYEVSLSQVYENKQNCKKANTDIIVKAIYDNKIVKATDNKYYYLVSDNSVSKYSLVPETDNSYELYKLLLGEDSIVKVGTADSSRGIYYVLKNDGNMYSYTVNRADYNSPLRIVSRTSIYNDIADSRIINFNYAGEYSSATYIETENSIYRMIATNYDSCSKYADVTCTYEMKKDELLGKHKDRIIVYNGSMVITDYQQIFNASK